MKWGLTEKSSLVLPSKATPRPRPVRDGQARTCETPLTWVAGKHEHKQPPSSIFRACEWSFTHDCISTCRSQEWSFKHEFKHPQPMHEVPFTWMEITRVHHLHTWSCVRTHTCHSHTLAPGWAVKLERLGTTVLRNTKAENFSCLYEVDLNIDFITILLYSRNFREKKYSRFVSMVNPRIYSNIPPKGCEEY